MRRRDKELIDRTVIDGIIHRAKVCRLAMADGDYPYIVPLSFGYAKNTFYFHSAFEGKKLDILREHNRVCLEVDVDCEPVPAADACKWSMRYRSVIGFGKASFIEDPTEKRRALDTIVAHYAPGKTGAYADKILAKTTVFKVEIDTMTGKTSGFSGSAKNQCISDL
jgi:hypothetical protein